MSFMYKIGFSRQEIGDERLEKLKESGWNYEAIPNPREKIVELAKSLVGKPYRRGASVSKDAPNEFDCSSFVSYLYAQAGLAIPRISVDQYVFGEPVALEGIQAGDFIFVNTGKGVIYYESIEFNKGTPVPEGVDHVAIYLGGGEVAHATNKVGQVVIEKLSNLNGIVGARKIREADGERVAIEIPEDRKDLRNPEKLLNFLNEGYLIAAS
jgi:cell wall-associated NlpC family hydrolase